MTARQEARVGTRATSGETWSYETQRAPNVGEILQTARERKGVDLARAERETKIRARHLMALESGDLADLPAPVYARGFLRNYSTYLGLDADEMVDRWRVEVDQPRRATPTLKPPPQPITTPSRGFKLTSGLVVALVLAAIVFAFVGYVGLQLVRYTQNPEISLSGPAIRQLQANTGFITLRGSGTPNALITATGTDTGDDTQLVRNEAADGNGDWTMNLKVNKGENHFTLTGQDPETARLSDPLKVIVTVPVDDAALPEGDLAPVLPEGVADEQITGIPSAELVLVEPDGRLETKDGKVTVSGTSDAEEVRVSFVWRGNVDAAKVWAEEYRDVSVKDGVFKDTFQVPKGRWILYVTASIDGGYAAVEEVNVKSLNDKMAVRVDAVDGKTRVKITKPNGDVLKEKILIKDGEHRTFRVNPDVILRVGNSKAARLTVDGVNFGMLGKKALPVEYRLKQGQSPKQID